MKSKVIVLNKKFEGLPNPEKFKVVEDTLRPIKTGEFIVEAEYISVDAYQRTFGSTVGNAISAEQVAKIIESKNAKYPVGEYVVGEFGWRSHSIANEEPGKFFHQAPKLLTHYGDLPRHLALSVLGMPGNAAHFGFTKVCQPMKGNIVVVSGAAGGVGTIVGQIAKIKECRVIGITSSEEKGLRLIREVGYDGYVNYNSKTFKDDLSQLTKDNIDCYFDNVGGEISTCVLNRMKKFGRVAVSGAISTYNDPKALASEVQTPIKVNHLVMEGFSVRRLKDHWDEGIQNNLKWVKEGLLKPFDNVVEGFENAPHAFIRMFQGENFGKTIVKV